MKWIYDNIVTMFPIWYHQQSILSPLILSIMASVTQMRYKEKRNLHKIIVSLTKVTNYKSNFTIKNKNKLGMEASPQITSSHIGGCLSKWLYYYIGGPYQLITVLHRVGPSNDYGEPWNNMPTFFSTAGALVVIAVQGVSPTTLFCSDVHNRQDRQKNMIDI